MIRHEPEPQHEVEVLVARNRRATADGLPDGWLTAEEATDLMLSAAIEMASGYAERTFLAVSDIAPMQSRSAAAAWVERITLNVIADMMADAGKVADALQASEELRSRLEMGRVALFDLRLAELQASAILDWGRA